MPQREIAFGIYSITVGAISFAQNIIVGFLLTMVSGSQHVPFFIGFGAYLTDTSFCVLLRGTSEVSPTWGDTFLPPSGATLINVDMVFS